MKKIIAIVLVVTLCIAILSGCRNNSNNDENDGSDGAVGQQDYLFSAETIPFPELPSDYENIGNITFAGDIVYFTASKSKPHDIEPADSFESDAIFSMTIEGRDLRKLPGYSVETPPPAATDGGLFIDAMHIDGQGDIWVTEIGRYYILEEPDVISDAGSTFTIRKLDSNGAELLSTDISDFAAGFSGFYVSMFIIDDEGYIYIGCGSLFADETTIYVLDPDCKLLFQLDAPTWHNPFILTPDGTVAFVREQNNERFLQKIDVPGKTWGDSIHLPQNASKFFSGDNDFLVIYADGASLYGLSGESGEMVRILNWIDVGVMPEGLENISLLHDGRIFLTKSTPIHGSWDYNYELIFLTKTESHGDEQREGLAEKTELTLGTLYLNPPLQKAILQFNAASTSHYITVIDYSSNTTPDDTAGALLRFQTAITTGNIPDILFLSDMPFERLIALDLLVDLYPYLDSDPELSRDSLFESVLKASERNGKLYMINQTFNVSTIGGDPSILGEYPGWNVEEFIAVLDANPQADIPFGPSFTKQDILFVLLLMNLYEYVDMTTGTANFNNEDFIELLKYINTFPSEVGEFISDPLFNRELKAEGRQIMEHFIVRLHSLRLQKESFGGDIVFKGWPTADRNGHTFISHDSVAVTTQATDKDGAWDFIRTLLMEENQRDLVLFGFPINKVVFSERILEDMEPMSFLHDGMLITVEPTQDDVDDIISLINSTTRIAGHGGDATLGIIIIETATDFFNGLISAEDAARIIQNRVSIFLAEQG